MFLSVASFFIGILCLQYWSQLPSELLLCLLIVCALCVSCLKYWRVCFFLLGFLYASGFATYHLSQQLSNELQGQEVLLQGEIIGLPEANARRVRFDFKVRESAVNLPRKVRLSWYYPKQKIRAGQTWQFFVKLKKPQGSFNPGGFDYEKWLFVKQIGAVGYIRQPEKATLLATKPAILSLSVIRQNLIKRLNQQVISTESRALIKALTLGDKSAISPAQWQVLRQTGTNHLMAISGLHIGLVAGIIYFIIFRVWLRLPSNQLAAPQVAAIVSLMIAVLYAALAGFSIPTQRALIMLGMFMLSIILRRHISTLNIFAYAIFLVLLIDPLAVLSVGFYLSFFAVFSIIYALSGRLGRQGKFSSSLKIHFVVALGLLPLLLFFFQSVALISPLANIIAVPVVSFIVVPFALLAVSLLPLLPDLAGFLLYLVDSVLQLLWQFLSYLADQPFANIVRPQPDLLSMLLAIIGGLLILAPKGIPARYLGVVFLLPLFFTTTERPALAKAVVTVLDVGQGLAVVVQTATHTLVFDTGARFSEKFDMGQGVVLPFLQQQSIHQLDMLLISHADNDHIGGADSILKSMPTRLVMSSAPEQLQKYHAVPCKAGQHWRWDQVDFYILSPPKLSFNDENNNSCVLKIVTQEGSVLLTGDIEAKAEYELVNHQAKQLQADVLIAPHHGSKTSSTQAFLQAVKAHIIVIPAAAVNRFGFPHAEVIARYQALGATYFVTGKTGAITIEFSQDQAQLELYRELRGRYWHTRRENN